MSADFDAIVVGSGMSGGWAAKELCERGLKTLVIERGRHIEHGTDYTDFMAPWELPNLDRIPEDELFEYGGRPVSYSNAHFRLKVADHPISIEEGKPFRWFRGYHLGGKSTMWARQSYRLSEMDLESNKKDGHGVDWPIRYADLAPWYDHVERFAGISGDRDGLEQLPDGQHFQPAMEMTCVEKVFKKGVEEAFPTRRVIMGRVAHLTNPTEEQKELGRGPCQYRDYCNRGCSYGGYFSSLGATLPAARRTGNLTIVTDSIGHSIDYDPQTGRATGVRVIDAHTKEGRTYTARVIFVCAGALSSAHLMLNSRSESFPTGIANSSDHLGRNVIDHVSGMGANGDMPGYLDKYYYGRRPNGIYIPRYSNVTEEADFVRGYGFQGGANRGGWGGAMYRPGIGADFKHAQRTPGGWSFWLAGFGEMLPNPDNRVTLHPNEVDKWGIPLLHINCELGENDRKMAAQANADAVAMLKAAGFVNVRARGTEPSAPGSAIHEMGTARMGRDPSTSVLNSWNQAHDVPNLFVTDGASFPSGGCQNPSLSYMAITARAANHAAELLQEGVL